MVTKKITIPIYEQEVEISYCRLEEFNEYLKKGFKLKAPFDGTTKAAVLEVVANGKRRLFLFFNHDQLKGSDTLYQIGLISHEMVHLTDYIMDFAGIKNDIDNNEPRAYLSGFLAKRVFSELQILMHQYE